MQQHTVRSVLRILAVTTVMVGVILILQTLVQLMMMGSMDPSRNLGIEISGLAGKVGFYGVLGQACISAVGLVWFAISDLVATKIVGEDQP